MILTLFSLIILPFFPSGSMPAVVPDVKTLAVHEISLENRYSNSYVNDVFKDNILLAVNYATDNKIDPSNIDWKKIDSQYKGTITLTPGQTFAFHDDVLPQFVGKVDKTTNAHFNSQEGFKSDGYLIGDGVCHLASILYWVAKDAGLDVLAPTRHDFAPVPDVPKEYGVSIYDNLFAKGSSNQLQNLYITNNKDKAVTFEFNYNGKALTVRAEETI
jgi:hypothetical protein